MKDFDIKEISPQLARPHGELGHHVADEMSISNKELINKCLRKLSLIDEDSLLEIGCAGAENTIEYLKSKSLLIPYAGVEISHDMFLRAKKLSEYEKNKNIKFIYKDFMGFKENEKYSKILAVNLIYFISDLEGFLSNINNHLQDGGKVCIGIRSSETLRSLPFVGEEFCLRSVSEIVESVENERFRNIEVENYVESNGSSNSNKKFEMVNHVITFYR